MYHLWSPLCVGSRSSSLELVSSVGEAGERVSSSRLAQPRHASSGECEVDIPESASPGGSGSRLAAPMLRSMSAGWPGGGAGGGWRPSASAPSSLGPAQLGVAALSSSNIEAWSTPSSAGRVFFKKNFKPEAFAALTLPVFRDLGQFSSVSPLRARLSSPRARPLHCLHCLRCLRCVPHDPRLHQPPLCLHDAHPVCYIQRGC